MPATIEIDVQGRRDAVSLMQRPSPYHPYPIQFAPEHWLVHAESPGGYGGVVARLPRRCPTCGADAWEVADRVSPPSAASERKG